MKKILFALMTLYSLSAEAQPANDDCVNAITLVPGTSCSLTAGTNEGAVTTEFDGCSEIDKRTVWYKFTATQPNHIVQLTLGTMERGIIDVVSSCASSLSTCQNAQNGPVITRIISGLTTGQEYFVVISCPTNDQPGTFQVCITSPSSPANDECVNAITLTPAAGNIPAFTAGSTLFATQSQAGCNGNANDDVWYTFVATRNTHRITVNQLTMQGTAIVQVFDNGCGALNSLHCFSNFPNTNSISGLVIGQQYWIRVYANGGAGEGTFNIAITSAPQNDECVNAAMITPQSPGGQCVVALAGSTIDATLSSNDCTGFSLSDDDVWYRFTASHTSHFFRINGFAGNQGRIELFYGTCGALTPVVNSCNGYTSLQSGDTTIYPVGALLPGTEYFFRVFSSSTSVRSNFGLCLTTPLSPVNDECAGAMSITVSPDSTYTPVIQEMNPLTVTGTRQAFCGIASIFEDLLTRDLWYSFTATHQQHVIYTKREQGQTVGVFLYTGSCGSFTTIACHSLSFDDTTFSIGNLIPGTTYTYRITYQGVQNFLHETAVFAPTVAANDECNGAITIIASETVQCTTTVFGNTATGTHSRNVCSGSFTNLNTIIKDVWYRFLANHSSIRVRVIIPPGSDNSTAFEVFSGSCGSLTSIFCSSQMVSSDTLREQRLNGLTVGQEYFIRVFSPETFSVPFSICVKRVVPPANDECNNPGVLPVAASLDQMQLHTLDLLDATQSQAGCSGIADDDVWFSFTAPNDSVVLYIEKTYTSSMIIQPFSGSCGSLVSLGCITKVIGANESGIVLLTALTPGTVYMIRTYGSANFNGNVSGTQRTGLYEPGAIPANDACASAILLNVSPDNTLSPVQGSNTNTFNNNTNCQTGQPTSDVWYKFVAAATSHKVVVEGDLHLPQLQVLNGSCTGPSVTCVSALYSRFSETTLTGLTIGNTYFIRVFNNNVSVRTHGNFRIAVTTPQIPLNDNCGGAIILPVCPENTVCNNSGLFSTNLATASGDINACSGSAGNDDTWFRFTATDKPTAIAVELFNELHTIQLLQGNCGSLTSLVCLPNRNILYCPPLTTGQDYFIRLFSSSAGASIRSSFKIKVYEVEPYRAIDPYRTIYDTSCLAAPLNLNGQFDVSISCPSNFVGSASPGNTLLTDWKIPTNGTPDFFGDCGASPSTSPSVAIPSNNCFGYQEPRSGRFYTGLFAFSSGGSREYIEGTLSGPMIPGRSYMVSMYISLSDYSNRAIDQLGIRFNTSSTAVSTFLHLNQVPQVVSPAGVFINEQKKWVNIRVIYIADDAYTHFIIGNFKDNAATNLVNTNDTSGLLKGGPAPGCTSTTLNDQAYYFIDDVSISEITGTGSACFGAPLPVTWLGFEVSKSGNDARLKWKTSQEFKCSHYIIERSADGINYISIGSTLCYNSTGENVYHFADRQPGKGRWYYRIKQQDLDGRSEYSQVRQVEFDENYLITLAPNPAQDYFSVRSAGMSIEKILLYDLLGKQLKEFAPHASNQYSVATFPAGLYWVKVVAGTNTTTIKLLKQ